MSDIVERLRDDANAWVLGRGGALSKEAADEIERLRGELERAERAETVITAIADHADCRGRSVWGCMDLIRDTLTVYNKERDNG